jgi:hypothetical protein
MGFKLMTMKGFTWHKTNKHKGNSAIGMGHMTGEQRRLPVAVRGKLPARMDASICQRHGAAPGELAQSRRLSARNWCSCLAMYRALSSSPASRRMASTYGVTSARRPAVQLHPGYALDIAGMARAFRKCTAFTDRQPGPGRAALKRCKTIRMVFYYCVSG